MRPGLVTYLLASGMAVSASAAALARSPGLRCVQPVFFSRATVCGSLPPSDGLVPLAMVFAVGLVAAVSPKAAFVVALAALNLLFAWTSRGLAAISPLLASGVSRLIAMQDHAIWAPLGLGGLPQLSATVTDLEGLSLLVAVSVLAAFQTRQGGRGRSVLLGLWTGAACLLALAAEVAAFDPGELPRHVTTFQALLDVAPWFTNADLLGCASLSLIGVSALFLGSRVRSGNPRDGL